MSKGDPDIDPRGLIAEAYRIDGIGPAECRAVFLDWALGLPGGTGPEHVRRLFDHYAPEYPDHPMTEVLREGLTTSAEPVRRGGHHGREAEAE
jgi:hypothetical protein